MRLFLVVRHVALACWRIQCIVVTVPSLNSIFVDMLILVVTALFYNSLNFMTGIDQLWDLVSDAD